MGVKVLFWNQVGRGLFRSFCAVFASLAVLFRGFHALDDPPNENDRAPKERVVEKHFPADVWIWY